MVSGSYIMSLWCWFLFCKPPNTAICLWGGVYSFKATLSTLARHSLFLSRPLSFVSYSFTSAASAYQIPSCICICSSCVVILSLCVICVMFLIIQRIKWVKVWNLWRFSFFSLLWALSCCVSVIGFFCCESIPSLCPPARLPKCWISIRLSLKGSGRWRWTLGLKEVGMGFRKSHLWVER